MHCTFKLHKDIIDKTHTHTYMCELCVSVCVRVDNRVWQCAAGVTKTYPLSSSMEPRRTFRRWLAVTGKGPVWPSGPTRWAPNVLDEMDCERVSSRGLCMDVEAMGFMAFAVGTAIRSWLAMPASAAPLLLLPSPRLPPFELELSRRNRPMTDLGCLGLFIPPRWAWFRREHSWWRATSKCTRYREI